VAAPPTIYRLDAAGEVVEVVVEDADERPQPEGTPAVAMAASCADERFDVSSWWSKQLGAELNAA
jgi:hypothetical protein